LANSWAHQNWNLLRKATAFAPSSLSSINTLLSRTRLRANCSTQKKVRSGSRSCRECPDIKSCVQRGWSRRTASCANRTAAVLVERWRYGAVYLRALCIDDLFRKKSQQRSGCVSVPHRLVANVEPALE
jgi:hypothetical protein